MTLRWDIRRVETADYARLATIFWRGVHEGAAPRYTQAERTAWLPQPPEPDAFAARLAGQAMFVAQTADGVAGFMSLREDGYLDFAYVLPEARQSGMAGALLAVLENHARVTGLRELTTRASDMAQPFFARHGWHVVRSAPQERDGVTISATDMMRDLKKVAAA